MSCSLTFNVQEILSPKAATDSRGTFGFKSPFWHVLILSTEFHTFLKIKIWNKNYTFNNESIYPFWKFEENPRIFTKLVTGLFLILFMFQSKFHCLDVFVQIAPVVSGDPVL